MSRAGGRGRRPRRGWRTALLATLLILGAWVADQAWTWPDVAAVARRPPATTAFIERFREAQQRAGRNDRVAWMWVPYESISRELKSAVVVAEDINFFTHHGFDAAELRSAVAQALEERELPRGASTISQQLAKNLWLSPSRNPFRKLKEAILTWQLERTLAKRRILALYLNVIEFGPGTYGVEAAARRYFGKPAAAVNGEEAAQLAASLPKPTEWHPGATSRAYQRYVAVILRRMNRAEFVWRQI